MLGWQEPRLPRPPEPRRLWPRLRCYWRRLLPVYSPHQASSDHVRAHVGCEQVRRQEHVACGQLQALRVQHEPWVRRCEIFTCIFPMLILLSSGAAAHGDYVFGWEGDSLQKAMDNGCNLNNACPKAGLTTQQPAQYNACTKKQQAPEAVDGCKPLTSSPSKTTTNNTSQQGSRKCPWAAWPSRHRKFPALVAAMFPNILRLASSKWQSKFRLFCAMWSLQGG